MLCFVGAYLVILMVPDSSTCHQLWPSHRKPQGSKSMERESSRQNVARKLQPTACLISQRDFGIGPRAIAEPVLKKEDQRRQNAPTQAQHHT